MAVFKGSESLAPIHRLVGAVRLCRSAALYRYTDNRWKGPLFFFVSILDVAAYASVLYVVAGTIRGLGGVDRFVPMLIGLLAIRWSFDCAMQASRNAHAGHLFKPYFARPFTMAVMVAVAGPSMIFGVAALILTGGLVLSVRAPADLGHMLGWGSFIALVQLLWNCVLALTVIHLRLRRFLLSETPIFLGFLGLLVVSPVAYQFSDIPSAAGHMLTSLNPMAHLIAGYQNSFWYIQGVSLEVIPLSVLLAVVLIVALGRSLRRIPEPAFGQSDEVQSCLVWDGSHWSDAQNSPERDTRAQFSRWQGDLPWMTGANLFYLIDNAPGPRRWRAEMFAAFANTSDSDRLLTTPLPLLSQTNRDRLCLVTALGATRSSRGGQDNVVQLRSVGRDAIILDGLVDHAGPRELGVFCTIVKSVSEDTLFLVTYRNLTASMLENISADAARNASAKM